MTNTPTNYSSPAAAHSPSHGGYPGAIEPKTPVTTDELLDLLRPDPWGNAAKADAYAPVHGGYPEVSA